MECKAMQRQKRTFRIFRSQSFSYHPKYLVLRLLRIQCILFFCSYLSIRQSWDIFVLPEPETKWLRVQLENWMNYYTIINFSCERKLFNFLKAYNFNYSGIFAGKSSNTYSHDFSFLWGQTTFYFWNRVFQPIQIVSLCRSPWGDEKWKKRQKNAKIWFRELNGNINQKLKKRDSYCFLSRW